MSRVFSNRTRAGLALAARLQQYARKPNTLVLAIPRGGVPVAAALAGELQLPLDVVLVKKIGHPTNREYAIGACSLHDRILNPQEEAAVGAAYIEAETAAVRQRLQEMEQRFRKGKPPLQLKGKTLLVVDDGIATGLTLLATLQLLRRQHPAKLVVAVPVAPEGAAEKMRTVADEFICLHTPDWFTGVGALYEDFSQVSDAEVIALLQANQNPNSVQ
ncbi:MAG: phosphoribosyltransferase [Lacibacter sp.]